ncbi:hypothetical protein IID19_05485 [Patescibacteria group bacterium]|nr:hypothetical protein [Patescibacteria group bacterium]
MSRQQNLLSCNLSADLFKNLALPINLAERFELMSETINNKNCRIFIEDSTRTPWQLFTLSQNKRDGSIYLGSPDFGNYEWLSFNFPKGKPVPIKIQQDQNGHISFHGLGQTHVRAEDNSKQLVISGHYLLKPASQEISLKHLFTVMPKQPEHVPFSPALTKKGDQLIKSSKPIRPFVAVVFALPRKGLKINFQGSMHVDEMEEIPGTFLGWHLFPLIHHDIFIFFYYTKYMSSWPKRSILQYWNGVIVPVFKGRPNRMIQVDFVLPKYQLTGDQLTIKIHMSGLDGLNPSNLESKD